MDDRPASQGQMLREEFVSIDTDARFSEAVVTLRDDSRLYFSHRVGERRAKAFGPDGGDDGRSQGFLDAMRMFRLNARHLEILFDDGSLWEWRPPAAGSSGPAGDVVTR